MPALSLPVHLTWHPFNLELGRVVRVEPHIPRFESNRCEGDLLHDVHDLLLRHTYGSGLQNVLTLLNGVIKPDYD